MNDKLKMSLNTIRANIFAQFCLTVIAITAMMKLTDPENIVINVIVAISSFVGGYAVGGGQRKTDFIKEASDGKEETEAVLK